MDVSVARSSVPAFSASVLVESPKAAVFPATNVPPLIVVVPV